jgi:hypothetical protein
MDDLRGQLGAAFIGALFALLIKGLLDAFVGVQGRKPRHLTALHRLEWELNDFYNRSISWKGQLTRFAAAAATR